VIAEIYGPKGRIHYRRPVGDPLIKEAMITPGYAVLYVTRETQERTGVCTWCGGTRVEEVRIAYSDKIDKPCRYCGDHTEQKS
jgi:hypothetical protein